MADTTLDTIFVFELYRDVIISYRVKECNLPPSSSLLAAVGFEFMMPLTTSKGRTVGVLIPARHLRQIAYYADAKIGPIDNCQDAESVIVHPGRANGY